MEEKDVTVTPENEEPTSEPEVDTEKPLEEDPDLMFGDEGRKALKEALEKNKELQAQITKLTGNSVEKELRYKTAQLTNEVAKLKTEMVTASEKHKQELANATIKSAFEKEANIAGVIPSYVEMMFNPEDFKVEDGTVKSVTGASLADYFESRKAIMSEVFSASPPYGTGYKSSDSKDDSPVVVTDRFSFFDNLDGIANREVQIKY